MMPGKVKGFRLLAAAVILFLPAWSTAQVADIDTSEYLPLFVNGALDYNLKVAASLGYDTEVERLIFMAADIESETGEGATPLIYAVYNDRLKAVNMLLKYNADPNKLTTDRQTPLLVALKTLYSRINSTNAYRSTVSEQDFHYIDIAEALIRAGADIDYQDRTGATALNYASVYGLFYLTDLLLYYKADVDKKANDGTTPLMAAIWAGYADIADMLIQNGANLEARDNAGFTPFLTAAQNGDTLILSLLIKNGVDIYEKNIYGWNALNLAIKSDQTTAVRFLLSKGDKWNDAEISKVNPYSVAAKYGRKKIIKFLEESALHTGQKKRIDQMAVSLSSKFTINDFYTGFNFMLKEPFTNIGFGAGFDTKPWYTRVLYEISENNFIQYRDKSSIVYASLFKDLPLTKNIFKSNWSLFTSLSLGYSFGNKYRGTNVFPENKFKVIPELGFKWMKKNFIILTGFDYMKTDYNKIGPFWVRMGCAFNFYFDSARAPGKIIRWY